MSLEGKQMSELFKKGLILYCVAAVVFLFVCLVKLIGMFFLTGLGHG